MKPYQGDRTYAYNHSIIPVSIFISNDQPCTTLSSLAEHHTFNHEPHNNFDASVSDLDINYFSLVSPTVEWFGRSMLFSLNYQHLYTFVYISHDSIEGMISETNILTLETEASVNEAFTIPNVQNEFKTNDYVIVHFATHGVFGGTGKNSFFFACSMNLDSHKFFLKKYVTL